MRGNLGGILPYFRRVRERSERFLAASRRGFTWGGVLSGRQEDSFSGTDKAGRPRSLRPGPRRRPPATFGHDGLAGPSVSPDGRWVASWSEKEKKLISVSDGRGRAAAKPRRRKPDPDRLSVECGRTLAVVGAFRNKARASASPRRDERCPGRSCGTSPRPGGEAGLLGGSNVVRLSADARWCAFGYKSSLNDLYLVEGLR